MVEKLSMPLSRLPIQISLACRFSAGGHWCFVAARHSRGCRATAIAREGIEEKVSPVWEGARLYVGIQGCDGRWPRFDCEQPSAIRLLFEKGVVETRSRIKAARTRVSNSENFPAHHQKWQPRLNGLFYKLLLERLLLDRLLWFACVWFGQVALGQVAFTGCF